MTSTTLPLNRNIRCVQSVGRTASFATALLLVAYFITTIVGFANLPSQDDPIEDPYFTIMEILILLMLPTIVFTFGAFHHQAVLDDKQQNSLYSLMAWSMFVISSGISSSVHAMVLMANRSQLKDIMQASEDGEKLYAYIFSFEWPSVVYALDILAWDWFFGLGLVFAALALPWRPGDRMVHALQILLLLSGILSLLGLIAVPLDNIQVRILGIIGYAVVTIPVFCILGVFLAKPKGPAESDAATSAVDEEQAETKM